MLRVHVFSVGGLDWDAVLRWMQSTSMTGSPSYLGNDSIRDSKVRQDLQDQLYQAPCAATASIQSCMYFSMSVSIIGVLSPNPRPSKP